MLAGILAMLFLTFGFGANIVRAADSGIYGGGAFYQSSVSNMTAACAGYSEVVVWNIAVASNGDLNFNYEFPLCSGGSYIGNAMHSDFPGNLAALKQQTTVKRISFSIGSSNVGVFQNIQSLVNSQGTGPGSLLYQNFLALKNAIPAVDAIDFDDENCYDTNSMTQFAVMLGNLGFKVSLCPYTNSGFWTNVASQINSQRQGTVDRIHLQCYAGGGGNSPNWNFGIIPFYPGLWDSNYSPSGVQAQMANWKSQYHIAGGFMWLYEDMGSWNGHVFTATGVSAQYAAAINNAIGAISGTHLIVSNQSGLAIDSGGYALGGGAMEWAVNNVNDGQQQKWIFRQNPDTSWYILNQASGYVLEDPGFNLNNGAHMDQWTFNGGANQRWWVDQQSDGSYKIWNQYSSGALDNSTSSQNGYPIIQWTWNGQIQQRWSIR